MVSRAAAVSQALASYILARVKQRAEDAADRLGRSRGGVLRGRARVRKAAVPGRTAAHRARGKAGMISIAASVDMVMKRKNQQPVIELRLSADRTIYSHGRWTASHVLGHSVFTTGASVSMIGAGMIPISRHRLRNEHRRERPTVDLLRACRNGCARPPEKGHANA